jgi:hypothetical protein
MLRKWIIMLQNKPFITLKKVNSGRGIRWHFRLNLALQFPNDHSIEIR